MPATQTGPQSLSADDCRRARLQESARPVWLLETERQQAKLRLETMKPEGVRVRIRETQRFVEAELSDLRKLLNGNF